MDNAFLDLVQVIVIAQLAILALEEVVSTIVLSSDVQQTQSVRVETVFRNHAKAAMIAQLDFSVQEEYAPISVL